MPNCFTLTKKGETELSRFADIDDEMRKDFGAPPDTRSYFYNWYDHIGLYLACGWSFDRIIAEGVQSDKLREIAKWLQERYEPNAWFDRIRRD